MTIPSIYVTVCCLYNLHICSMDTWIHFGQFAFHKFWYSRECKCRCTCKSNKLWQNGKTLCNSGVVKLWMQKKKKCANFEEKHFASLSKDDCYCFGFYFWNWKFWYFWITKWLSKKTKFERFCIEILFSGIKRTKQLTLTIFQIVSLLNKANRDQFIKI